MFVKGIWQEAEGLSAGASSFLFLSHWSFSILYEAINICWASKEYCTGIRDWLDTCVVCWGCTRHSVSSWPPNKQSTALRTAAFCAGEVPQNKDRSKAEKPTLKYPIARWLKQVPGFEPRPSTSLMTDFTHRTADSFWVLFWVCFSF